MTAVQAPCPAVIIYCGEMKDRAQMDRDIPEHKQGWWHAIHGQTIELRDATADDLVHSNILAGWSKAAADYLCHTSDGGSLVPREAVAKLTPIAVVADAARYVLVEEGAFKAMPSEPARPEPDQHVAYAATGRPVGYRMATRQDLEAFAVIGVGARVATLVGSNENVPVSGVVQKVTSTRFHVQFPAVPEAGIQEPFTLAFRKHDGVSVSADLRVATMDAQPQQGVE